MQISYHGPEGKIWLSVQPRWPVPTLLALDFCTVFTFIALSHHRPELLLLLQAIDHLAMQPQLLPVLGSCQVPILANNCIILPSLNFSHPLFIFQFSTSLQIISPLTSLSICLPFSLSLFILVTIQSKSIGYGVTDLNLSPDSRISQLCDLG